MLHFEHDMKVFKDLAEVNTSTAQNNKIMQLVNTQAVSNASNILLSTALVQVKEAKGNWHIERVLLDSGAQSNFISKNLSELFNCQFTNSNYDISGIVEIKTRINEIAHIEIR